jgi:DnaJ-domain-containing protein 1
VDNLLERNPAGEFLLSPPTVAQVSSPTLKGAVIASARRWIAANGPDREEFLTRVDARPRPVTEAESAAPTPSEPKAAPEPEPLPLPDIEVAGLIDAYEVLGVPLTAKQAELSKRYRELARKCHPDRVADLDEEIRKVADRKFRRLTRAYEIVMAQF